MNSPHEINLILIRHFHQFRQTDRILFGIRLPPVGRTMIRIILGTIYIGIQFIFPVKLQLSQPGLVAPGRSVESLDNPTETHVRIIPDLNLRQLIIPKQLHKSTHGIIRSPLIIPRKRDSFLRYLQIIPLQLIGNLTFSGLHGTIALFPHVQG